MSSHAATWWQQVITFLNGELCVNASYSGSRVSGDGFPAGHSEARVTALGLEIQPDIILVYIGMNDFGYHVPIHQKHFRLRRTCNPRFFMDAYDLMLKQLRHFYPKTKIICATLMKSHVRNHPEWYFDQGFGAGEPLKKYNAAIRHACRKNKVTCLRLPSGNTDTYETLDGAHPTAHGHAMIAQCWKQALKAQRM